MKLEDIDKAKHLKRRLEQVDRALAGHERGFDGKLLVPVIELSADSNRLPTRVKNTVEIHIDSPWVRQALNDERERLRTTLLQLGVSL